MYVAHLAKGCQLNDCDATSRFAARVPAAARGLNKSKDSSVSTRPSIDERRLRQRARPSSSSCASSSRGHSVDLHSTMGRRPANSRSALGLARGRLALKLHRRKHAASGAILTPARCCERFDPHGGELRTPQLFRPVRSAWPIVRTRVRIASPNPPPPLQGSNLTRRWRSACTPL